MADSDSASETLKSVTSDLKRALECPICLDVVKNPFKLCARGHLMCVGCLKSLTNCPTCQGNLLIENPVCIKNILEYLPHKCRHFTNGCNKIIKSESSHEKFCQFQRVKCKLSCCTPPETPGNKLLDHFKTAHPHSLILQKKSCSISYSKLNPSKTVVCYNLVHIFNRFFWLTMKNCNETKQLTLMLEVIPIMKFEGDIYFTASITNGKFDFRSNVKAFIPENPKESGKAICGRDAMNQFCMTIPPISLPHLIDSDGDLSVSFDFFQG